MIQVTITTSTGRKVAIIDPTTTLREIAKKYNINYDRTPLLLDGASLEVGQMDKSLLELGIKTDCLLSAVLKLDNA